MLELEHYTHIINKLFWGEDMCIYKTVRLMLWKHFERLYEELQEAYTAAGEYGISLLKPKDHQLYQKLKRISNLNKIEISLFHEWFNQEAALFRGRKIDDHVKIYLVTRFLDAIGRGDVIRLVEGSYGAYIIRCVCGPDRRKTLLIQQDMDFPSLANTFGYVARERWTQERYRNNRDHVAHITAATNYLNKNLGLLVINPGYTFEEEE